MALLILSIFTRIRKHNAVIAESCTLVFLVALCLSACTAGQSGLFTKAPEEANDSRNGKIAVQSGISLDNGKAVFERNNCAVCHIGGGNTMDPGHPIKGPGFAKKYADDMILENTIRVGFPEIGMPSFTKKQINEHEMKNLIAYVRTFTGP